MSADRDDLMQQQAARYAKELRELYQRDREQADEMRRRADKTRAVRRLLGAGGVRMVFQPIVDLGVGGVVGFEALARFDTDPPRGPDAWFGDAEEVGLGTELELAAIRSALTEFDRVPGDAYVSLNVSPSTAVSTAFLEAVDGHPAERIVIEVTEHARVDDYERLAHRLFPLRAAGGRLAVDDAGSGFASLRHILAMRPDIIKLDITLTRDIDVDRARRALATALIVFAGEIGASLVAEGIETGAELDTLRELGVSHGQGYFLAKPAPLASF